MTLSFFLRLLGGGILKLKEKEKTIWAEDGFVLKVDFFPVMNCSILYKIKFFKVSLGYNSYSLPTECGYVVKKVVRTWAILKLLLAYVKLNKPQLMCPRVQIKFLGHLLYLRAEYQLILNCLMWTHLPACVNPWCGLKWADGILLGKSSRANWVFDIEYI